MTLFQDFGLAEPITRALAEEKYVSPTPIQTQTVPLALARRDIVGIAQTGTGKTAAFALPILHQLFTDRKSLSPKACRALVLCPTRELASQVLDSFRVYGRHLRITAALAIGGVSMGPQIRALSRGVDVLVATPGRLLDLVRSHAVNLGHVEFLVLDEADRMLDMGFIHDIRSIVAKLPVQRQTLFFSATMPGAIADLADRMLRNPAKVAVNPTASTAERVEQRVVYADRGAKAGILANILKRETIDRVLVFTRTKRGADKVVRGLAQAGIAAQAIHGNKSQNQRDRVLTAFRKGSVSTLVATDIAARGIDVDGISHVVNFDVPNVPETYVHRIGRTARAGADGVAISLCDGEERAFLRDIEKLIRMTIPVVDMRTAPRPDTRPTAHAQAPSPPARSNPHRPHRAHDRGTERQAHHQHRRPHQQPHQPHQPQQPQQQKPDQQRASQEANSGIGDVAFLSRDAKSKRNADRRSPR